jgi:hypothetical protein
MDLRKLYDFRAMNSFQVIAITGLVMTLLAHLILSFLNKEISSFGKLYLCWVLLFTGGYLRNIFAKPDDHHHHH